MLPRIVQIVKRFGPVGGMESYVWRLTHGLSERGLLVSVVCEHVMGEVSADIEVIQVEESPQRPRWKSMLRFRQRVDLLLKDRFQGQKIIVHSHERSLSHHVTTFHGPPILSDNKPFWLHFFSPRVRAWRKMEMAELLGSSVQMILPVSTIIESSLIRCYPSLIKKRIRVAWPGVVPPEHELMCASHASRSTLRFLFVGKEWKRKGLLLAIEIVNRHRKTGRDAILDIYGVSLEDVPQSLITTDWLSVKGWVSRIPWSEYDALIHPAEKEPFGMVVAEARSYGVPVLISDRVGASDLGFTSCFVVDSSAGVEKWVESLNYLLSLPSRLPEVKWSWDSLVEMHCSEIYPRVRPVKI